MSGLKAAGFETRLGGPNGVNPGDVVVMWNRYWDNHELATRIERQGGIVLVAENGYLGPGGISPHSMIPREIYALAVGGHNGSGSWYVGGPERWEALNVPLKPWRVTGDHILVCPNRSFGRPDTIMPPEWPNEVTKRLQKLTKREIRLRPHPGNSPPKKPIERDLEGAWCVVIWSSSVGVQALINGVPVVCEGPYWIAKASTTTSLEHSGDSMSRLKAMRSLAWAQWHVNEIASGVPFIYLLDHCSTRTTPATASLG